MTREELRTIRKAHGLTQKSLGELLGYSANYIARLEQGETPIAERFAKMVRLTLGGKRKKSSQAPLTIHFG